MTVEVVAPEQILHRPRPERDVLRMVPARDVCRLIVHVAGDYFLIVRDDAAHRRRLEDPRVHLHAALARRLDDLGEQIAFGVFVSWTDHLVTERGVRVVLVVRADPYQRKLTPGVVGERHAVIRPIAKRLDEGGVVGVAVGHHRVGRGRLGDEIERALDPFVEDRVGPHLDTAERAGDRAWLRRRLLMRSEGGGGRHSRETLEKGSAVNHGRILLGSATGIH